MGDVRCAGVTLVPFFFSSRRRHTRLQGDWSSDVCSSDLFLWDRHELIWIGFDAFVPTVACVASTKQQNSLWREQRGLLSHMWDAERRVLFAPAAVSSLKMR